MEYFEFLNKVADNIHQCWATHESGAVCFKYLGHSTEGNSERERNHVAVEERVIKGRAVDSVKSVRHEWSGEDDLSQL